jgi:type I restriction enzyme R subunit
MRDFTGRRKTMILRATGFQELLVNYPRPKRVFVVAMETEDTVSSNLLIRDAAGNEHKPADYLTAFAKFIHDNENEVEAIGILLNRPRAWRTAALFDLRRKLRDSRLHFTEDNLRKAHAARYGKALVDIISMVKHAADEQQPLLTAPERVERAMAQIVAAQSFTEEQRLWLERIRAHLVQNLSITADDFQIVPVFTREGGWRPANRAFGGKLEELLGKINEAIAA